MRTGILILLLLNYFALCGKHFTVSNNGHARTLRDAVNIAKSGDTIFVEPGLYREGNIVIEKSLVIIGEGYPVLY